MIITITGHRPNKLGNEYGMNGLYSQKIYKKLSEIVDEMQPKKVISGMALGVDLIWANLAIKKRIPLIAAIPFEGQEKKWPSSSQQIYLKTLSQASQKIVVCSGGYASWKMQKRNEWMVDNSDLLIVVWDGSAGGTFNCVNYAVDNSRDILRINPQEL